MELAFVLLFVLLGSGAILYAGMSTPPRPRDAVDAPTTPTPGPDETDAGGET